MKHSLFNRIISRNSAYIIPALIMAIFAGITHTPVAAEALTSNDYRLRGNDKYENDDVDGAYIDWQKALELDPNSARANNNICLMHLNKAENINALSFCDKAIRIDSTLGVAYENRMQVNYYLDKYHQCINDANTSMIANAKKASYNESDAYFFRGLCKFQMHTRERDAIEDYNKALLANKKLIGHPHKRELAAEIYAHRGEAHRFLGNNYSACKDWNKALSLGHDINDIDEDYSKCLASNITEETTSPSPSRSPLPKPTLQETLSDTPFQWKQ